MVLKGMHFTPRGMISTDFLHLVFTGMHEKSDSRIIDSVIATDRVLRTETER